jgi:hypothetical protein
MRSLWLWPRRKAKTQAIVRRRQQEEIEAAHRQKEEEFKSGLEAELIALMEGDRDMPLLTAVEYITPDPAHRILLYRRQAGQPDHLWHGSGRPPHADAVGSTVRDLAVLERRAVAEGFQA